MSVEKIEAELRARIEAWPVSYSAEARKLDRALLDELSRLREALKPFAREALEWVGYDETENLVESWRGGPSSQIRVCHLRAAARVLPEREGQDG